MTAPPELRPIRGLRSARVRLPLALIAVVFALAATTAPADAALHPIGAGGWSCDSCVVSSAVCAKAGVTEMKVAAEPSKMARARFVLRIIVPSRRRPLPPACPVAPSCRRRIMKVEPTFNFGSRFEGE